MRIENIFKDLSLCKAMNNSDDIIEKFKVHLNNRNVIIYGAGIIGVTLYRVLRYFDIDVKLIVDMNVDEIKEIDGFTVQHPNLLKNLADPEKYVLIIAAGVKTTKDILVDFMSLNMRFETIENGGKLTDVMQCVFCAVRLNRDESFDLSKCSECSIVNNSCPVLRKYGMKLIDFRDTDDSVKKSQSMTMIGYILGTICTLSCKHCCESIPLYPKEKREFVDTQTVMSDIQRLASASRFLTLIEFVGGEPFLHPNFPEIIRRTLQIPNVGYVHSFTNGTVVPSQELLDVLKDHRIAIYISNYTNMLSEYQLERLATTKRILTESGICYTHGENKKWFDFSSYDYCQYNNDELSTNFNACFIHNCNRLHKGILYACAHHYAGHNLGILKPCGDTVHIHELSNSELVKSVENFKRISFVEACRYCRLPFNAPVIMPGEPK